MENFEFRPSPEIEVEEKTFTQEVEQYVVNEIETNFDEQAVTRLTKSLERTNMFLLGEMHGVAENPNIIYTLFKKFGFKRLALEWDGPELQDLVNEFLTTGQLYPETIKAKDGGDGIITAGHFTLLQKLRQEGLLEDVILFDSNEENWNERDKTMADNVLLNQADERTLVIARNLHARTEPFTFDEETELHHPMGEYIKNQVQDLPSGGIIYRSGQYFNCGVRDFLDISEGENLDNAQFYQAEDGLYYYSIPEAHLATVPNPREM